MANDDQPDVKDLSLALHDEMRERFDGVDQQLHQIKIAAAAIHVETSALIDIVAEMNRRSGPRELRPAP